MSSVQFNMDKLFEGRRERIRQLTGEGLKQSGMESVERHTPDWYRDAFLEAVESFPSGQKFTVEDVRKVVGDPPEETHYNCMGPLMVMLARKRLAKKTGYHLKATRVCRNANELAEWIRL